MKFTSLVHLRVDTAHADAMKDIWQEFTELLRYTPGYIDSTLHRDPNNNSDGKVLFINVSRWESSESWERAFESLDQDNTSYDFIEVESTGYEVLDYIKAPTVAYLTDQVHINNPTKFVYPLHQMVGFVKGQRTISVISQALIDDGFAASDIAVFYGPKAVELATDVRNASKGNILARMLRGLSMLGTEGELFQQTIELLSENKTSFMVMCGTDRARIEAARDILKKHGGFKLHYFGDSTIEDFF